MIPKVGKGFEPLYIRYLLRDNSDLQANAWPLCHPTNCFDLSRVENLYFFVANLRVIIQAIRFVRV